MICIMIPILNYWQNLRYHIESDVDHKFQLMLNCLEQLQIAYGVDMNIHVK